MKKWNPNNWINFPAKHLPTYEDKKELDMVLSKLKKYPPLVFAGETRSLKKSLADVVDGKAFLLQGGDCAESFAEFHPDNIRDTLKAILQMSLVLTYSASMPVVKVGRIAGQFSKPRSSPIEKKGDKELPSYLGDNINGTEFTDSARIPDPKRLFRAYSQSASTLNLIRAFSQGGFADLRQVHLWNLGFINENTKGKYKDIEDKIRHIGYIEDGNDCYMDLDKPWFIHYIDYKEFIKCYINKICYLNIKFNILSKKIYNI